MLDLFHGEVDGAVTRAGMDLSQPVLELGAADQCVAVLCDRVYFVVVVFHVATVPEADLHQSLTADFTDDSRCRGEHDLRVPWSVFPDRR